MKKSAFILMIIVTIPFLFCSCFSQQASKLTLSDEKLEMTVGDTIHVTVMVEPEDADAGIITWESSDNSVAEVDDGTVTAKAKGTAVITAESESGLKRACNVTVADKKVESITISEGSTSVKVGGKIQLEAKALPTDAPSGNLSWSSSDSSVAVVNSEGYVTGVAEGVVNITCKTDNGDVSASCTVTVKAVGTTQQTESASAASTTTASSQLSSSQSSASSTGGVYADCVFPYSSQRKLTESEAASVSSAKAQEGINEIYARHGYVFKSQSLQNYFESKSWYTANANFSTSDVSEIESYNISLLTKYRG